MSHSQIHIFYSPSQLDTAVQTIQQQKQEFKASIVDKDGLIEHKDQKMALMGQDFEKSLNVCLFSLLSIDRLSSAQFVVTDTRITL